ncbi:hypothetical protein [Nitrosomonas sp. Nm34]|uniref:hypothetical protein n=1 Tax=Nitrosomonas sp. Nm34 TaxID=1881055 RepID=UPI0008E3FDC1|nr:hypothetical protein [Nitrosomonas sp. Nm34]SFI96298.1 hypothetical protein SAMN05428978_10683 [Nitrosomonas sp. Nm34]
MNNNNDKSDLRRVTFCAEQRLMERVEKHRHEIMECTRLRISTSAAISSLIQAGLDAQRTAEHR